MQSVQKRSFLCSVFSCGRTEYGDSHCVNRVKIRISSGPNLPVFGLNTEIYAVWSVQIRSFFWSVFSCIRTEYGDLHCAKRVKIQSLFWSIFSCIWTECGDLHCMKSVQIRIFLWSVFSCIRTEYGDLHYVESVQIRSFLWSVFSGITLVNFLQNWLNWFHFHFLEGGLLVILIDWMIFLSPLLDVTRMSTVNSFFPRTARLLNSLPIECFPFTYDLSGFKSGTNGHLLTVGSF